MKFALSTGDWRKDTSLTICAPATRGIWIDLLCVMQERQVATLFGDAKDLSRLARCTADEMVSALIDLKETGAADVLQTESWFSVTCRRISRELASRQAPHLRYEIDKNRTSIIAYLTERDGPGCIYCGTDFDIQIDHRHPISRGGDNRLSNLQLLCGLCNRRKSNKLEAANGV
jgi:5-methylcytosine-specific restriction endonuclease McrA